MAKRAENICKQHTTTEHAAKQAQTTNRSAIAKIWQYKTGGADGKRKCYDQGAAWQTETQIFFVEIQFAV